MSEGWSAEFAAIEPFVQKLQEGQQVDKQAAVEAAINATEKDSLLIVTDEDCGQHAPLAKQSKDMRALQLSDQPENEERLKVLVGTPPYGILMMDDYLDNDLWLSGCQAATISDILRVHEYAYVKHLLSSCAAVPSLENGDVTVQRFDRDTVISANSYKAATKGAGVVIAAVDAVMKKKCHAAFCAIRPPGHHVGPWGAVE